MKGRVQQQERAAATVKACTLSTTPECLGYVCRWTIGCRTGRSAGIHERECEEVDRDRRAGAVHPHEGGNGSDAALLIGSSTGVYIARGVALVIDG